MCWTCCFCSAPWFLLFSCYSLLHLALLCFPRKSGPLQPLTTHDLAFSLPSRSSILNLVYLCYLRSPISDFRYCSSILSLLSNAMVLTQFGFFKRELYPISHNALIMDCFSRANLYGVPRVTVSSFSSEIDRSQTKFCSISITFYRIQIRYSERDLWWFYQGHFFEMNFRSPQKHWL